MASIALSSQERQSNSVLFLFPRCENEFDKVGVSIIGANTVCEFKRYASANVHVNHKELESSDESIPLADVIVLVFLNLYDKEVEENGVIDIQNGFKSEATNLLMKKMKEATALSSSSSQPPVVFLAYDAEPGTNVQNLENVLDYYSEQERAEFAEACQVHLVPFWPKRSLYKEIMKKLSIPLPLIQPDMQFDPFSYPIRQVSNYIDGTRIWVINQIREWFKSAASSEASSIGNLSSSSILHLHGPPGIGKSTLLSNVCLGNNQFRFRFDNDKPLMKDNVTVAAVPQHSKCGVPTLAFHFFQAGNVRSTQVLGAIQTLALQLCASIPEFRGALYDSLNAQPTPEQIKENNTRPIEKSQNEYDDERDKDVVAMINKFIINPLSKCTAPPHPDYPNGGGLIILDAIEECVEAKELVSAIRTTWANAPSWARLLISSSTQLSLSAKGSSVLDEIKDVSKQLVLSFEDESNQDDIRASIVRAIELNGIDISDKEKGKALANEIQIQFGSNPLILYEFGFRHLTELFQKKEEITAANIKEGLFPPSTLSTISTEVTWEPIVLSAIAKGLGGIYNEIGQESYQKIISAIAASREPLPLEILSEAADNDVIGDDNITSALIKSGLFLIEKGDDHKADRVRVSHDIVTKFFSIITSLPTDYQYLNFSIPRGHAQLASACDQRIAKLMRDQDTKEDAEDNKVKEREEKKKEKKQEKEKRLKRNGIELDDCESESDYEDNDDNSEDDNDEEKKEIDLEEDEADAEFTAKKKKENKSDKKKHKYPLDDPGSIDNADIYSFSHGSWHLLEVNGPVQRSIMHSIHFQTLLYRLSCSPPGSALALVKVLRKEAGGGQKTNVDEVLDRVIDVLRKFDNTYPSIDTRELASQILGRMYEVAHTDKPTFTLYFGAKKYHPHVNWYHPLHTELERVCGGYLVVNHEENVSAIAFAPLEGIDSQRISHPICATGSDDGEIRIWSLKTGRCLYDFGNSSSQDDEDAKEELVGGIGISALAISPSGRRIVAGYRDGSVRLFDIQTILQSDNKTGTEITSQGDSGIALVNFSTDGMFITSKNINDKTSTWSITGESVDEQKSSATSWCQYNLQVLSAELRTVLGVGHGSVGFTCDSDAQSVIRAFAPIRIYEASSNLNKSMTVVVTQGSKVHILKTKT